MANLSEEIKENPDLVLNCLGLAFHTVNHLIVASALYLSLIRFLKNPLIMAFMTAVSTPA